MTWFFLAIAGHVLNGFAFIIDKALLTTSLKRSATYAAMIGSLSIVALVATPFVHGWPTGTAHIFSAVFGITFVAALWAFFESLKRGEASRVVPIVGSLIPVFTLVGSLDELRCVRAEKPNHERNRDDPPEVVRSMRRRGFPHFSTSL